MISCICPTANRRAFLPAAIDCFLRQTYTDSELIILDDGTDRVEDLIPPGGRVRYYHNQVRRSVGLKRNMACGLARGEVIAHWDDDDWSAPNRLETQLELLMASEDNILVGYHTLPFYSLADGRAYLYSSHNKHYACGTSFMYRREWWRNHQFLDMRTSEDNTFQATCGSPACVDGSQMMVATRHGANTCTKAEDTIALIGDKLRTRQKMIDAGVRPPPEYEWSDYSVDALPEGFKERMGIRAARSATQVVVA